MQLSRYVFIVILVIAGNGRSGAQTERISRLKIQVSKAGNPAQRLAAIFALCRETESLHTDTLYAYTLAAKKIALADNDVPALREAGYFEAYSFYRKNKLDSVPVVMNEHLPKLKQESPGSPVIVLFELLGARYLSRKQQYKEALGLYYQILTEAEKKKDTLNQMKAMAGIGSVLNRTDDFEGALNWFLKGLQMSQRPIYRDKTIYLYTNAAVVFTRLDKPDSAAIYVKQGIEYARAAENLGDLGNALGMYAGLLMDMNGKEQDSKKYAEAEKQLREALAVAEKIGDPNDIISNMGALGMFYWDISQSQKGIAICGQAIAMIRKYNLPNKLPFIYEILARNYNALGKYKEEAETLQLYADSKDSVYEQNSAEAMSELKTKYEVQKKENTIIRQQLDLVKKDNLIYSSVLLFLLAAVTSFFVFRSYRRRQRHKAEMAIASAEETERKRIAADLHDNLGSVCRIHRIECEPPVFCR
jgi:tetratricopeptide (TPR) repeat protein